MVGSGSPAQHDDYQTPSMVNIAMHPAPPRAQPTTTPSSSSSSSPLPQAVYTGIPTAAPHPMAAIPTAAPVRKPEPHAPVQAPRDTSPTAAYPVPTLDRTSARPTFPTPANYGAHNLGQFPEVDGFTKRTTGMSYNAVAGSAQGAVAGGGGVRPAETVCLQYLSVEHDVGCSQRTRRDAPSEQHLTLLLQHHGASASTPFTAASSRRAAASFRNLMPLGSADIVSAVLSPFHGGLLF